MRTCERSTTWPAPAAFAIAVGLCSAGCRAPEPLRSPLSGPRVTAEVGYSLGSPLRGAEGSPPTATFDVAPERAFQAVVTFVALERLPEQELDSLGAQARFVVDLAGERPLREAPVLLAGARAGRIDDVRGFLGRVDRGELGRHVRLAELRGALPLGVSARFQIGCDFPARVGTLRVNQGVTVAVYRARRGGEEMLDVALEAVAARATKTGAMALQQEVAALDLARLEALNDAALILRSPFDESEARALLILVSVTAPPPAGAVGAAMHDAACAACVADLAREAARGLAAQGARPAPPIGTPDLEAVRRALVDPDRKRGALLTLASLVGARFAEDMSFAEGPLLDAVTASVSTELSTFRGGGSSPALRWSVDRAAMSGALAEIDPDGAPPALAGALLRRAGAVGRLPMMLLEVLESSADGDAFDRGLAAANGTLLADGDPAVRVGAFEWLEARGEAPPGFDPLATARMRRAALHKAADAAEAARIVAGGATP